MIKTLFFMTPPLQRITSNARFGAVSFYRREPRCQMTSAHLWLPIGGPPYNGSEQCLWTGYVRVAGSGHSGPARYGRWFDFIRPVSYTHLTLPTIYSV